MDSLVRFCITAERVHLQLDLPQMKSSINQRIIATIREQGAERAAKPRPRAPSPDLPDRLPLPARTVRALATLIGCEKLPAQCATELEELLACHLRLAHAERKRDSNKATGKVEAAIVKAMSAVRQLTGLDTGIDADSYRVLKPRSDSFLAAAEARLAELRGLPRQQEPLRMTGPFLRRIFERHAAEGFNTRGNLRRFAFIALCAADIVASSVDEAHLDRLDDYLDADPQLP